MEFKWDDYISAVSDQSAKEALSKLQEISTTALQNGSQYVIQQCQLIQKYTEQKGKGEITEDQYNSLLADLADVLKMQAQKANLESRKLIVDLASTCADIALNCLGSLIVF